MVTEAWTGLRLIDRKLIPVRWNINVFEIFKLLAPAKTVRVI